MDDLLIIGHSPHQLLSALELVIHTLVRAGFTINLKKSDLTPTQDLVYLGGRLRTDLGRVFLPIDRRNALISVVRSFNRVGKYHTARVWLQVLGLMAATISTVRFARLRMRSVQFHFMRHWGSWLLNEWIMITRDLCQSLQWWLAEENLSQGLPFSPPTHTMVIVTDASREGWGGHLLLGGRNLLFSGLWPPFEHRPCHINLLELRAIKLTIRHVATHVRGQTLRVECDNTTAVSSLNEQGGTRSKPFATRRVRFTSG